MFSCSFFFFWIHSIKGRATTTWDGAKKEEEKEENHIEKLITNLKLDPINSRLKAV